MKAHFHLLAVCSVLVAARRLPVWRISVGLADTIEVTESSRQFEFEFTRNYSDNIKHCELCSTGTSRIEKAKYNAKVRNSTCPLARDKWIFRRTTKIANIVVRRTTWIAAGSVTRERSSYFGVRF